MAVPSWAETYIDYINGSGFWWKNFSNINNDFPSLEGLTTYPPESTSWLCGNWTAISHAKPNSGYYYGFGVTNILRLDVNSVNDVYSFELHLSNSDFIAALPTTWGYNGQSIYIRVSPDSFGFATRYVDDRYYDFSASGSLAEVLEFISYRFRNVDLYVDAECWSRVSPVTYNWYSVASLKGINDFSISLPVLSNINDGNPVSGASSSAFTKTPSAENNIKNLVDTTLDPVATDNSATIFYTIPALKNDSYSSVKVYAKIGEVPKCDETDDIIEDIDPTINEISLENLEYESEYFFCIQSISNNGLKLSSNVESITTGNPIPAEYRQYINLINGCNGEGWDFFWRDYTVTGASRLTAIDNPANFSYVRPTGNWSGNEVIVASANTSNGVVASSIITLNINKQENNTYKVLVSGYDIAIDQNRYAYSFQYSHYTAQDGSLVASNDYVNQYVLDNYWKMRIFDYDFSTLMRALQFLTKNVRNCNIYVDGVLWSKANNTN